MITPSVRDQFASVLKDEQLADISSCFSDPDFFDEVPLYSRYAQVDFLKQHGEVDQLLLELSLEYLQKVRSEDRFVAITVGRNENEYIVPYVFVCSNARREDLHLSPPSKGLGEYIQNLMQKINHQDYRIFEDHSAVSSDDVRVFIEAANNV